MVSNFVVGYCENCRIGLTQLVVPRRCRWSLNYFIFVLFYTFAMILLLMFICGFTYSHNNFYNELK